MATARGDVTAPGSDGPAAPAELVLQNGRLSGARRALRPHVTVIGQAPGCDIRLDVQGVSPLHCLLVQTPSGLVLRDLQTQTGTHVNGERVATCPLRDGDLLSVGPFRFKVRLPALTALPDPESTDREKEALRIQAAAVAAQQAALTEAELRHQQRVVALEQQEAQLAAHLEEKRRRLIELRDQARQARAELQAERAAHEQRVTACAQEQSAARREIAHDREQVQAERRRLLDLRKRMKRRWHRHWAGERAALRRRERELAAERRRLEHDQEQLLRGRDELQRQRLHFNGETELGGRNLQAAWEELHRRERQWQEECAGREALYEQEGRRLIEREIALATAERALAVEGQQWLERRDVLQSECDGLENRVAHLRDKVRDRECAIGRLEARTRPGSAPAAPLPALPAPPAGLSEDSLQEAERSLREREAALESVAGELADQRLQLVEQCQSFVQIRQQWQQEHEQLAGQLEELGQRLQVRERDLAAREMSLHALECGLRHRQEELDQRERSLEGWQCRLTTRTASWEAARDHLLVEVQAREEASERRLARVTELRRRWHRACRRQIERWRAERVACDRVRLEYAALREELLGCRTVLEQEQRTVAEWALAVEEYRQECLESTSNPAAGARELEQLRQRWAAHATAAEQGLAREREALRAEAARIRQWNGELENQARELREREVELTGRQAEWEQRQVLVADERGRIQHALHRLRLEHAHQQRELNGLREELERVAGVLLHEAKPPAIRRSAA